ncbi:MAG: hypothetical protein DI637_01640 [Citromicrobium sp.]|nr:MAG: hypothetical protein DI637_01640 [Citromicrobium sp.]
MQKTKSSRSSDRTPPTSKEHRYIAATFFDNFGISRRLTVASASSFSKKKLAAAARRTVRMADAELDRAMRSGDRETALAIRRLRKRERAADQAVSSFIRRRIKTIEPEIEKIKHQPKAKITPRSRFLDIALPRYGKVIFDSQKRRGVFMRVQYYGAKTAKPGVAMRVCKYIFRGCALDDEGRPMFDSNLGLSVEEAICGFDHLEQINRSAQKNAKVLFHTVLALDHRWSKEQQFQVAREWAEECFGRHGLPHAIALHEPDPDGDARNWHAHVLSSYRPMVRIGPNEWDVGEALRTDLDNPASMQVLRENFARAMTRMSREVGQCEQHTALSNAARGLPIEPQKHLGEARTRQARAGNFVAANEENHSRVERSLAALAQMELFKVDKEIERRRHELAAARSRMAKTIKSLRAPSRAIDCTRISLPRGISHPLPRVAKPIASVNVQARSISVSAFQLPSRSEPVALSRTSSLKIANLRFSPKSPEGSRFRLPPPARDDERKLGKAAAVSTPHLPTLSPQCSGFSCPDAKPWPVPSLISMEKFAQPQRSLDFAEQDQKTEQVQQAPSDDASTGKSDLPLDLEQLFKQLKKKKRLVHRAGRFFALPADVLEEGGVRPESLSTPAAQEALRTEHRQQVDDLGRLVDHFAAKPGDLYPVAVGWRAHQDVPRDIRDELDRWLMEPQLQAVLRNLSLMAEIEKGSEEHGLRIGVIYDLLYPTAKSQAPPPPSDAQAGPLEGAIFNREVEPEAPRETKPRSPADEPAPRPAGTTFPQPDVGR